METKKQLTDKVVGGILMGGFSFLIISLSNGMEVWTAVWWTVGIVAAGFICAILGIEKVSATTMVSAFKKVYDILVDDSKDLSQRVLEAQLVIKQNAEVWNDIWNALVTKMNATQKPLVTPVVQDAAKQAVDQLKPAA